MFYPPGRWVGQRRCRRWADVVVAQLGGLDSQQAGSRSAVVLLICVHPPDVVGR
jgi:hypothetical protein